MIDIDPTGASGHSGQHLNVLILQGSDDNYCTAARDWSDVIVANMTNASILRYEELYETLGNSGLMSYVHKEIRRRGVDVLYFDTPISAAISLESLAELRRACFLVGVFDDNALFFTDWYRYIAQELDLVLSHDYVEKFRYQLYGTDALFFPQITDLAKQYDANVEMHRKDIPVSSVGRIDRVNRQEMIDFVESAGVGLQSYGPGTPNGFVSDDKRIQIYQRSQIGLNFSGSAQFFHSSDVMKIEKNINQVKGRLWELALGKALILTEHAPCLEKSFKIGHELDTFSSKDELLAKIRHYQDNPTAAADMALAGYERAKSDVNPEAVVKKVFNYVALRLSTGRKRETSEIVIDPVFVRTQAKARADMALRLTRLGKLRLVLEEAVIAKKVGWTAFGIFTRQLLIEAARLWAKKSARAVSLVRYLRTRIASKSR